MNPGDTAWVLLSTALVFLMTPGVALFYGGLVDRRHVGATMLKVFGILAIVSLQWVLFGYSLAFGPDRGGWIGDLSWALLRGVGVEPNPDYAPTIPHLAFAAFQLTFALITPALIVGALVERMQTAALLVFAALWATFVYDPLAHWVWGVGGWLRELGVLDFAGGTVVHISAGLAGLVGALVLGPRRRPGNGPHNLPLVLAGTALLWFGWFGFNAGSALQASGLAATALMTTNTAAAAAALSWLLAERLASGRYTLAGACTGAVCGLVAVTPAAGFVTPAAAAAIGLVAGPLCYAACTMLKARLGYDDVLDVFGAHGVAGTWGALATGIFANPAINEAGRGLLYGNPHQLLVQLVGVVATWAFVAVASWVLYRIVGIFLPLRVSDDAEVQGLDVALHGQEAYGGYLAPAAGAAAAAGGKGS